MSADTFPVMRRLEEAVKTIPGWSPPDQLLALYLLAFAGSHLPGEILELGVWCGRSTLALGLAAQKTGGVVHSIDLFPEKNDWYRNADGSYSFRVKLGERNFGSYDEQTVWAEPFERDMAPIYEENPSLYNRFCNTVAQGGIEKVVKPFRGDLEMFLAEAGKNFRCRLAFIDAHHGYQSVTKDIQDITPHLVPGGWICFDDAFTSYEGVNRAITEKIIQNPDFENCQQLTRKMFVARKKKAS